MHYDAPIGGGPDKLWQGWEEGEYQALDLKEEPEVWIYTDYGQEVKSWAGRSRVLKEDRKITDNRFTEVVCR
jgi:hypothetical protein